MNKILAAVQTVNICINILMFTMNSVSCTIVGLALLAANVVTTNKVYKIIYI